MNKNGKELNRSLIMLVAFGATAYGFYIFGRRQGIMKTIVWAHYETALHPEETLGQIIRRALY